MASCANCGVSITTNRMGIGKYGNVCQKCFMNQSPVLSEEEKELQIQAALEKQKKQQELESIILTTETAPTFEITQRIEIITAECAFGMNVFKDLFVDVRNIVGGRSESTQKILRDSRKAVLSELKKEAYEVGANAVVGVDLDYSEFGSGSGHMLFIVASGTAVVANI